MRTVNQNQIFCYDDYRLFLRAWFSQAKSSGNTMSLGVLARKTGMSRMAIKYVLDAKRHLAEERIEVFARAVHLQGAEQQFFKHLVQFNKAKDRASKSRHFEAMLAIKRSPFKEQQLGRSEVGLFQEWYYPTICEMSYLQGFKKNATWIQQHIGFKISKTQIEKALVYLESHGLLKGQHPPDKRIKLAADFASEVYDKYQQQQLDNSKLALSTHSRDEVGHFTLTISVDDERYALAKKMVSEFRHRLHDLLSGVETCGRVIQINTQLFEVAATEERAT